MSKAPKGDRPLSSTPKRANAIFSCVFWTVGVLHFGLIVVIFGIGLLLFSPRTLYPGIRLFFRNQLRIMGVSLKIGGLENFDRRRSCILMGNHESLFDAFAIPAAIPIHFVAVEAAYHFSWPIWGWLIKKWGNIAIPRKDLPKAIQSLNAAGEVLKNGTSILILPEGHRTMTGEVAAFKKGPFHLALAAKADILPFALDGLYEYKSKHSWRLNPTTVRVNFGKPIRYESYKNGSVEDVQQIVRRKIMALK